MKQTFEQALVEQCAPTLAGMKPASLFRIQGPSLALLSEKAEHWNELLSPLGMRVQTLRQCAKTTASIVYVYREGWVSRLLADADTQKFLTKIGYTPTSLPGMLEQLSHRLCLDRDYPHEIGVFLGYPLEDVIGFIENQGRNFTCCGYWKVYGDPTCAQQCFARYRSCTERYKELYQTGTPILHMIVAS